MSAWLPWRRDIAALGPTARALRCPVDWLGFEARLGVAPAPVDLGVRLAPETVRDWLRRAAAASLARVDPDSEVWRNLREFAVRWTAFDAGLECRVPFLFLEFDAPAEPHSPADPSVFAALDWMADDLAAATPSGRRGSLGAGPGFAEACSVLRCLRGETEHTPFEPELARCFDAIPAGGMVLHVAAMLARPGRPIRLSAGVPRRSVGTFLEALQWGESAAGVTSVLDRFATVTDFRHPAMPVQIDFDLGTTARGALGVTLRPPIATGWPTLLDALVREQLCDERRAFGLLGWPGAARAADEERAPLLRRDLSHVKVVCAGPGAPRAKAYFGIEEVAGFALGGAIARGPRRGQGSPGA